MLWNLSPTHTAYKVPQNLPLNSVTKKMQFDFLIKTLFILGYCLLKLWLKDVLFTFILHKFFFIGKYIPQRDLILILR